MASPAVIGALRVVIGADSASLDKGLKDANASLARFSAGVKNIGLIAAGALAGLAGGVSGGIAMALKDADKLGKAAQSIGLPVEELSKLRYVADLAGVDLESLSKSTIKLSRNMSEIAGGNVTGGAAMAFKSLGISVKNADGTTKDAGLTIEQIADKFSLYRDGANKTALAVELFGKSGAAMIPLLNMGSAAIREAKMEAEEFGLIVSKKTAIAAETFNDNVSRLGWIMKGVFTQVVAGSAETLTNLSNAFVESAKNAKNFESVSNALNNTFKVLASGIIASTFAIKQFSTYFAAIISAGQKVASLDFKGALSDLTGAAVEIGTNFIDLKDKMTEIWSPPQAWSDWRQALEASNDTVRDAIAIGDRFVETMKKEAPAIQPATNALKDYLASLEKRKQLMGAELATMGQSEAAQERARIQAEAMAIAQEKQLTITPQLQAKISAMATSYGELSQRLQESRQNWQFVEGSLTTVASGLTDVIMGTKTAAVAFKEMALSIIRDFIQMTIKAYLFRAANAAAGLSFGGGGTAPSTGVVGVAGSTPVPTFPKFAQGGSFVVPGAGGIDSQLATMRVTPGERVSVTKDGGYPGGNGANFTYAPVIDARGVDGAQVARLEQMLARDKADFASRVIAVQRDARQRRMG